MASLRVLLLLVTGGSQSEGLPDPLPSRLATTSQSLQAMIGLCPSEGSSWLHQLENHRVFRSVSYCLLPAV